MFGYLGKDDSGKVDLVVAGSLADLWFTIFYAIVEFMDLFSDDDDDDFGSLLGV